MNKGIINQEYLEENIKKIDFYANEENSNLNKIYEELKICSNYYNSSNKTKIIDSTNGLLNDIEMIYKKRMNYKKILEQVIYQYNQLGINVKNNFDDLV